MFFANIAALLLLVSGIQAGPIQNADSIASRDIAAPVNLFEERALPPCEQIWPVLPSPYPTWTNAERLAQLQVDIDAVKGVGWRPSVCSIALWNCVYVQAGVSAGVGGFGRAALWTLDDGSTVEVYAYWQSTIQWRTAHGSINSYMAHGVDYVCVRGTASVLFLGSQVSLVGDGIENDTSVPNCLCHYPLDEDKILYPIL